MKAVIIMGPPGAGKGTQAGLLVDKYDGWEDIKNGRLLRSFFREQDEDWSVEIEGKRFTFEEEKEKYDEGLLVHHLFILYLVRKKIEKLANEDKEVIFSGSPRTEKEAERLMPLLSDLYGKENVFFFFVDLSVDDAVFRNSHRRVCELMEHSMLWNEETKNLEHCPLDGSKLIKRSLDKPEIIRKRFRVFEKETLPAVEWARKNGYRVIDIDGKPPVAEVHEEIITHL